MRLPSTIADLIAISGYVEPFHSPRSAITIAQPSAPFARLSYPTAIATESFPDTSAALR